MDIILLALAEMTEPFRLLMLVTGTITGLIVGVVPGIGGIFGLALFVPLTYQLDPYAAFALLLGMSSVTTTSDTIPAVLLGVPGTVGAVATVVDGHPMARRGEAARAFGAAYSASLIGGVAGALLLAISIPFMRPLMLHMQTPDFFAVSAFGLSVVGMLAGSQPLKGLAAAMLGLLLAFVGIDANAGIHRWTFGQIYLWEGIPLVVLFLGLFGLPELAGLLARGSIQEKAELPTYAGMWRGIRDTLGSFWLVIRCSWIGTILGAIPGVGIAAIDWISYGHAAQNPGEGPPFGQGNVRGVIAPESANNAKEGGALIPTLAFGVPGSAPMALLLGAFMIHGLVPGPDMLSVHAPLTVSMVFTIAAANILGAVICLFFTRPLARLANVPAGLIVPLVVVFMIIGAFQNNMDVLDLLMLGGVGALGMAMKELNWPRSAFALGFVLAPMLERNFFLTYQIHGWGWLTRPLVLALFAMAAIGFGRRAVTWYRTRGRQRQLPAPLPDLVFSGLLLALAVAAFVSAGAFPFDARMFPMISAGILAALALAIFLQAAARWRDRGTSTTAAALTGEGEWAPVGEFALKASVRLALLAGAASALLLLVGHIAAAFVFVLGSTLMLGAASWRTALASAMGAALFVYAVFDLMVSRAWPAPLLKQALGL
ncbi:tripartite tricarboxylate transporter permease [Pelagibacterium lacus]|uniref:DUF112 domain-containing protein n=1 Tax=Pelagibacterium lacus TaxID=2282655 RepID=A0A369W8H2_9HYPH|nr:tripartite tricarboxylate transporter permease [Pelagibacterium lacus]RDE10135.1 hypothetical protein DVH29_01700 [Pelagibacterium lacus]